MAPVVGGALGCNDGLCNACGLLVAQGLCLCGVCGLANEKYLWCVGVLVQRQHAGVWTSRSCLLC